MRPSSSGKFEKDWIQYLCKNRNLFLYIQDIDNFGNIDLSFDDFLHDDEFEDDARHKRSPCFFGNGGGTGGGAGGSNTGGGAIDVPTDGDGDYEELTARRRNNHGRRRSNNAKTTKRRRKIHNLKNNEVQEVQEEILTRRKRQANYPDFGGQMGGGQMGGGQMGGGQMGVGGGGLMPGLGGGDLKDKVKQIGSQIIDLGASVHEKIKETIGSIGKH